MAHSFTLTNGVARITLDDGKVNALSSEALGFITASLAEASASGAPTLLSGRPGIFSAGFDLKELGGESAQARSLLQAGVDAILAILRHPRPVLTVCTGHAYPMGAFLMLASDLRLAADGPFRIGLNETAINMAVPEFALALARSRLEAAARTNISVARMFTPQDASQAGYVDMVVSPDQLGERAEAEMEALCNLNMAAFADTKARLNAGVIRDVLAAGLPRQRVEAG
ncbi:crotonase/enoyl-CoA hydratase family protein [Hyphomonas sp.]|jgi:enoyl-CoA hydratase|uniref:crotonase/enoyl-CoA hydratase family protein n=1 Tax=Hyphomonas sp. TaxID=87 RepID=UPI0032D99DAA